jgi:hypothetical protein
VLKVLQVFFDICGEFFAFRNFRQNIPLKTPSARGIIPCTVRL